MFAPIAGIIANVVEGVASNAITNRMQKGKITAIVRGGVRYVREKTCKPILKSGRICCGYCGYPLGVNYCPKCGARVVENG